MTGGRCERPPRQRTDHAGLDMAEASSSCLGPVKMAEGKISPKNSTSVTLTTIACRPQDMQQRQTGHNIGPASLPRQAGRDLGILHLASVLPQTADGSRTTAGGTRFSRKRGRASLAQALNSRSETSSRWWRLMSGSSCKQKTADSWPALSH